MAKGGTGGPLFEQVQGFFDPLAGARRQADIDIAANPAIFGSVADEDTSGFSDSISSILGLGEAADTATTALGGATVATDAMSAAGQAGASILGGDLVKSTADAIVGTVTETATNQTLNSVLLQLTVAAEAAAAALTAVAASGGLGGGGGLEDFFEFGRGGIASRPGLQHGGAVFGPGGPRSDSIPAFLSDGEFVVNADATRKNFRLLEAINSGSIPKMADGGTLPAMPQLPDFSIPSTAARGGGGARNITIEQTINVNVPPGISNPRLYGTEVGHGAAQSSTRQLLSELATQLKIADRRGN